jgi:hypothetical protein
MDYTDIPFSERSIDLPLGFSLIWPFRNQPIGKGPYELFLDNNALIRAGWLQELPDSMASKSVISPFHALSEQWVSNASFRDDTEKSVDKLIKGFTDSGAIFSSGYSKQIANQLQENDSATRVQWMLSYLYVVLLFRIATAKKDDEGPSKLLSSLKQKNVSMFNGCIILCSLADYLRNNKGLKLLGDSKPAFSYISSFIAFHANSKHEDSVDESYLRNRAGDLSMWLSLPALIQNGYEEAGEPVVVTQDKALKKLIFRCIPFARTSNGLMATSFDRRSFESDHADAIEQLIVKNTGRVAPPKNREEMLERLDCLRKHVVKGAADDLVSAVDHVWEEWVEPGFFSKFVT